MNDTGAFQEEGDWERRRQEYHTLIQTYSRQLFNFGIRFCTDEEVVKDCIQQLYLDLWNRDFNIDHNGKIKSYLFKSIRNRVLREKQHWNRNETLQEDYNFVLEFNIETKMLVNDSQKEVAVRLQQVLNNLPPRQREIIYLRFYEDLSPEQIALIMNINRQSVHNLLQKAYANIRVDWKVLVLFLTVKQVLIN